MSFYRYATLILILMSLLLIPNNSSWAQKSNPDTQQSESDVEMLRKAQQDLRLLSEKDRQDIESARKVEVQLWDMVKRFPNSLLREQMEEALIQAQEILAERCLNLAYSYFDSNQMTKLEMQGAEFWLVKTIYENPKFSRRDEALLALAKLYVKWGRHVDAIKHLQKIVCNYPNSKYIGEAYEQFNKIGVSASEDCDKLKPE